MTVAERVRKCRARQRAGRVVLCVEADEMPLIEALIVAKLLEPTQADDPAAVVRGVTRLIEVFSQGTTQ
jgi:hypothetical protein